MRDFAAVRRHIQFTFQLKLAYWSQLPWQLAGLAHVNFDIVRECARRCLELADLVPEAEWERHHVVTQALFGHGKLMGDTCAGSLLLLETMCVAIPMTCFESKLRRCVDLDQKGADRWSY